MSLFPCNESNGETHKSCILCPTWLSILGIIVICISWWDSNSRSIKCFVTSSLLLLSVSLWHTDSDCLRTVSESSRCLRLFREMFTCLKGNIYLCKRIIKIHFCIVVVMRFDLKYTVTMRRRSWCTGYRRWKWTRPTVFKSWTRLFAFYIALIFLGKAWIKLISFHLWANCGADWTLQSWHGNWSGRKKISKYKPVKFRLKLTLCRMRRAT